MKAGGDGETGLCGNPEMPENSQKTGTNRPNIPTGARAAVALDEWAAFTAAFDQPGELLARIAADPLQEAQHHGLLGTLQTGVLIATSVVPDIGAEPAMLGAMRDRFPMATDIDALMLKRAGREFYDDCMDLTLEQIQARVNAHIVRLAQDPGARP